MPKVGNQAAAVKAEAETDALCEAAIDRVDLVRIYAPDEPTPEVLAEAEEPWGNFLRGVIELMGYELQDGHCFSNFYVDEETELVGEKHEAVTTPGLMVAKPKRRQVKIGIPASDIWGLLRKLTRNWPKRVGGVLVATKDGKPLWLDSTEALFAWVGKWLKKPVRWACGEDKVSKGEFHAHLLQDVEGFDAIEAFPHEPPLPNHLYLRPPYLGSGDGKALAGFLDCFNPSTRLDRSLMKAGCLSMFAGITPGSRPILMVQSEDDDDEGGRGTGKTTFVKMLALLAGGSIDIRPTDDIDKVYTRLLSPAGLERRVGLIDNVKTLKMSWADLEALVTTPIISGRQLYVGEGRRPNSLTWFLTLNAASLSKDMAQRCVIIRIKRPTYSGDWEEKTRAYVERYTWAIIGDILAILREPFFSGGKNDPFTEFTRWGEWERAVLSRVDDPGGCQKLIAERQSQVDADDDEADIVRTGFVEELTRLHHDPDTAVVFIKPQDAARIVNAATNQRNQATNRAGAYLGRLTIKELKRTADSRWGRGWRWTGSKSQPGQAAEPIGEPLKTAAEDFKEWQRAQATENGRNGVHSGTNGNGRH
jgi:hypothetical protein